VIGIEVPQLRSDDFLGDDIERAIFVVVKRQRGIDDERLGWDLAVLEAVPPTGALVGKTGPLGERHG
jgi:hypothetical protein